MTINTTTLKANLTTKINATSGTTDAKEFLLLGKAVEAVANTGIGSGDVDFGSYKITYSNNYPTLSDLPSASTYHGMFAHVHAENAGFFAHGGNWMKLVNYDTSGNLTISGDLTVNGTTTTINSTTMDVDDINITVAKGAADAAAANGAGLSVDGASATFNYANSGDKWTMNKPLDVTGAVTATGATVNGSLDIEEVKEQVRINTTDISSGANTHYLLEGGIEYRTTNAGSNWSMAFHGDATTTLDSAMSIGQSITYTVLVTQGGTGRYPTAFSLDGGSFTPKWQGGSAPTSGNANSIDAYTFTFIKTANGSNGSGFTKLASVTQFA